MKLFDRRTVSGRTRTTDLRIGDVFKFWTGKKEYYVTDVGLYSVYYSVWFNGRWFPLQSFKKSLNKPVDCIIYRF